MKIFQAEKAGFCFGVKRALEMAEKNASQGNTVSLGPLIHNQQVVDYLKTKGIEVENSIDNLKNGQCLVIRSHGVGKEIYNQVEKRGIIVVDATCPFVQKAQKLADESSKTSFVIVVGDKNHPEVIGILGWAGENAKAIQTLDEAKKLSFYPKITVLAQTTQHTDVFNEIVEEIRNHTDELIVQNTICSATEERQNAALELAANADVMIVVGGRNSSNTRKLASISSEKTKTYLIETADELQNIWFKGAETVGLTAGASTPDWIIEEVYKKMTDITEKENAVVEEEVKAVNDENLTSVESSQEEQESSNEDSDQNMMASFEDNLPTLYRGAMVTGKVVQITNDEVFVDIGWKSEGVIPENEIALTKVANIEDTIKVGDTVSAIVLRVENEEGHPLLSRRKANEIEAKERLAELAESREEIQAKAIEAVKGGLLVDVGMRGFVPASQIQLGYVEDLQKLVGETLRLRIIEFDQAKNKLVLSQKVILSEEQEKKKEELLANIKEGDVIKGIVRRITNFGAFVDLGGVDGLLHVSDMAFSRVNHPSEIVKINDEVEVQVLAVDADRGRISLGLKQLKTDPWQNVDQKYPVGSVVEGTVVRIATFGAFVQLEDGVDALVHISQLADYRIAKVEDVVKVGEQIKAKVIECSPENKRISLSIRKVYADEQKARDQELLENQEDSSEVTIGVALGEVSEEISSDE